MDRGGALQPQRLAVSARGDRAAGSAVAAFAGALDIIEPDDPYLGALLDAVHHGRQENPDGTTTLWRPVGPAELELLRAIGMCAWPLRFPEQPIFYPVLNEAYARRIAVEWNVAASGSGFVTRFTLPTGFARRYPTRQAGGRDKLELWIPAEDLDEVNRQLVGRIEVVDAVTSDSDASAHLADPDRQHAAARDHVVVDA